MRTLGLMQPYLYPYIGYFQLMSKVDLWVSHDDVQYTKKGWCNRNRLWDGGQIKLLSMPLAASPTETLIKDKAIFDRAAFVDKSLAEIKRMYRRSAHFDQVHGHLESQWRSAPEGVGLGDFLLGTIQGMASLLSLPCEIRKSSKLGHGGSFAAQERVLAICQGVGAGRYLNAPGGRALYDPQAFAAKGIELGFLAPAVLAYEPFSGGPPQPGLSVVDMLFNIGVEATAEQARRGEPDWVR